jgi:phosphoribosylaminoimidazole carboxylase
MAIDACIRRELAAISDVLTVEIEHVNTYILEQLENEGTIVQPSAATIRLIQDKFLQKRHMSEAGVPCGDFMETSSIDMARDAGHRFGYPLMLKSRKLAYDGRGNSIARTEEELPAAFEKLGTTEVFTEKWVPFTKELAAMVVRTSHGVLAYPIVETVQQDNICHLVVAPCQVSSNAYANATEVCSQAIQQVQGLGIYGVEMFLLEDDTVLLNEIAPRPHNSGHYTIEACECDQFEMHLRAVLGLPCPQPKMRVGCAMMINILGSDTHEETVACIRKALSVEGAGIHWYGKPDSRKGRKMAHVTITAPDFALLRTRVEQFGLMQHGLTVGPQVGVIMGSDSDLPTMAEACRVLDHFGIAYECTVVSAHRTPTRMYRYAQAAAERGIKVIIAGAGGAAHLPGMVAALTPLPVVGVPVKTSTLSGNDSLLSIVQMPKGIPVATVAIGNAANAGLLAVRMLSCGNQQLLQAMVRYMEEQEREVLGKAARLERTGYAEYLANMG